MKPLSWNEIKDRALKFVSIWKDETSEDAEAKSFWDGLFDVFGVPRKRFATFETKVTKNNRRDGYIDLLWKGKLLVEHKSAGKDLDRAYTQAKDYFPGLDDADLPRYIVVCNFEKFRVYDLESGGEPVEFLLKDLVKNVKHLGFIAGYQTREFHEEDPVNIQAAELMGKLHDKLKEIGYSGHELEVYLVRLVFCLFADDTTIFDENGFEDFIAQRTSPDGSDLASKLAELFQILNTPETKRLKNLDEQLAAFPYVNGKLFEQHLSVASFDSTMRRMLLDCCKLDWGQISPAIFGSLFQSVMDKQARRNLGAHYTSEKNIMKLIKPLFLDELWEEFNRIKKDKRKLKEFHARLGKLRFLDPACGCGNFLVITYRELRRLELECLKALYGNQLGTSLAEVTFVNVDQFYGIELEEFPAQISMVAMWLIDHQMNMEASKEFGEYYRRLPLTKAPNIINGNALTLDWEKIVSKKELSFILGNPPFGGSKIMKAEQRKEITDIFKNITGSGTLDFVTGWYYKAADYIRDTGIRVGFVSTNSITQGEQVGVLWSLLLSVFKVKIHFAHTTFRWNNEARGKAAVHVVIVGFGNYDISSKRLFVYDTIEGEPSEITVKNINPYLVAGEDIVVTAKAAPLCDVPVINFGNMPLDGGNLLLTEAEKDDFIKHEPKAEKFIRRIYGSIEFINNIKRYCLWLVDASPSELREMPLVMERVKKVKEFRENSIAPSTQKHGDIPALFRDRKIAKEHFIIIPSVSSERRKYIPIGFLDKSNIASNLVYTINDASLYHFGILTSEMHMSWVRYVCGRLKSDYRYTKDIVYNNYPWPAEPSEAQKKKVEQAAQKVLDARAEFPDSTLADLYDPNSMPKKLLDAHRELDAAVDACYRKAAFKTELERLEHLFGMYKELTKDLFTKEKKKIKKSMQ